jgi:hypothetical protein
VLTGEAIRPQYRGRAVGSVQSGWAVGWGLAVLAQAILFSYLPARRWMFVIGALPALLVFYLRRYVTEPEIAAATRTKRMASSRPIRGRQRTIPITRAAPMDESMQRPFTNGPRSFIRTVTLRPVDREVTATWEPNDLVAAIDVTGFAQSVKKTR